MILTKKQATCVARHLQCYLLMLAGNAELPVPCGYCGYRNDPGCGKGDSSFRTETYAKVSQETGIELHWWKGLKPTPPGGEADTLPDANSSGYIRSQQGLEPNN